MTRSTVLAATRARPAHADEILDSYLRAIREDGGWRAAEALLSRVHGTPTQRVETEDTTKSVDEMDVDQLMARAAELLTRLEG